MKIQVRNGRSSTRHSRLSTPCDPAGPVVPQALQAPRHPAALQVPQQPAALKAPPQMVHLNWSHFKPDISWKPDEDMEAHLLCTSDWMNAHHFVEGVKVQRFCLTLLGEARLLYHSLEPINADWQGLKNLFRQQYSKKGNTREQLFHVW